MHTNDILKTNLINKPGTAATAAAASTELYCDVSDCGADNSKLSSTAHCHRRRDASVSVGNNNNIAVNKHHHKQPPTTSSVLCNGKKTGQLQQPRYYCRCCNSALFHMLIYLCIIFLLVTVIKLGVEHVENGTQMPKVNNIVGFSTPQFANVEKVFRKNFNDNWEREGAAVAVYYKGELVVDLQGGYADASALKPWTSETRTVVFSASKAIGALCIALLVDRGYLRYSDKVCQHWPEFANNGKENITIDWIMSHRAGLAVFDKPVLKSDALDHRKISRIIENQKPNWTPGTRTGYHAVTYGWLLDQIVRRVDPKRRSIAQFFREEVATPYGIDFHIGLPADEEHTVSRLSVPPNLHLLREIMYDPRILIMLGALNLRPPNSIVWKVRTNPDWLKVEEGRITFNDPELHRMEQVAALGITKARDLGKLFAMFLQGKIVSKETLSIFRSPQIVTDLDGVIFAPMAKGHGFYYEKHPYKRGNWLFGHPGYGGSNIMMDMEKELVIAYVTNGLKIGMGELTRTYRLLRNAVLQSI